MKIDELGTSDYVTESDVTPPITVTIKTEELKNFAKEGQPKEMKCVLGFSEIEKRFVCNKTNFKRIAQLLKESDSEDWVGKKIALWFNEDVEFRGEIVGGIRVRRAEATGATVASDAPDEQIPF